MGVYLNAKKASILFQEDFSLTYFVDKTDILDELVPILELKMNGFQKSVPAIGKSPKYLCITRPRRFGKTVMANMIASFFGKGTDSSKVFDYLKASGFEWYKRHLNQHNVIHIVFSEMPNNCQSYEQYISRIEKRLIIDLMKSFPDAEIEKEDDVWDALTKTIEYGSGDKFIFVLDEWDYIYHQKFVTEEEKEAFTKFLSILLKDQPYVEMVYMTDILPISKYSSGSELNMFFEFTMAAKEKFSEYFGFSEEEVDGLYERYLELEKNPKVSREELRLWYNGYQTMSGNRLYNPRSVIGALSYNQFYWTDSRYMNRLAAESGKMLAATKAADTKTMVEILERVHNTESPLIRYSNEAELSKVSTFVYLQAREYYDIRLEDRSGTGYVDYIFYPYKKEEDGIIIELKVDDTADSAIQQIKDRQYALNFDGRLGEEPKSTGRILAVGIAYDRKDENKRHECKVEVLRERLDSPVVSD